MSRGDGSSLPAALQPHGASAGTVLSASAARVAQTRVNGAANHLTAQHVAAVLQGINQSTLAGGSFMATCRTCGAGRNLAAPSGSPGEK